MFAFLSRERRTLRTVAVITLIVFLPFCLGCSSWRPVSVAEEPASREASPQPNPEEIVHRIEPIELVGKRVRFLSPYRVVELTVTEVEYPYARGHTKKNDQSLTAYSEKDWRFKEVDLRSVSAVEVREYNGAATFGLIVITGIVVGAIIVAVRNNQKDDPPPPPPPPPPTDGSCPLVYVQRDDGLQLVGELYAGAIFRSMQRTDLLPVPDLAGESVAMTLANQARETQYTDLLELMVVDHPLDTRAVSTARQEVMLVGPSTQPLRVTDLSDVDVTAQTASVDGHVWQTDLSSLVRDESPAIREGLVARFAAPPHGEQPVLELVVGNTPWSERTVERFFALTGDSYSGFVDRGNNLIAGPLTKLWCEREGLALAVEYQRDGIWEHVAFVPPIGPAARRPVAVPLPDTPMPGETIAVRITGGTGFWEVDQIGLSTAREASMQAQHIAPHLARNGDGDDEKEALASTDGRYQVLQERGERLQVVFDMPSAALDQQRSTFLLSSGYYNLHRPIGGSNTVATFTRIRDEPGGLAGFGIDLYKAYLEFATKVSASSKSPLEAE